MHGLSRAAEKLLSQDQFFSPLKPSQFGAWTLEMLDYLVSQAQVVNPEIMATVFINMANANPRASEVQDVKAFTQNFENILLAGSVICDRIDFRKAIQ